MYRRGIGTGQFSSITSTPIYRTVTKIEPLIIYPPSPLRQHKLPHVCSHILRGGTFLPLFCRTLFSKQVRYNGLGHRPRRRRIPKPEGRLTGQHRLGGRACRKLGGAESSPKNTSIALDCAFLSLTDITLQIISTLVCFVGRKISNFTSFSTRQNETAAEINLLTGTNSIADHDERVCPSTYFIPAPNLCHALSSNECIQ